MENLKESRERDFYRDTASPNLSVEKALGFSHYPCRPVLQNKTKENRQEITNKFVQYFTRPQDGQKKLTYRRN